MIPNITHNDIFWEGKVTLESWNKFYGKDLNLILNIGGDCIIDKITNIHEEGYNYLVKKQQELLKIIFNAIYQQYQAWQDEYEYKTNEKKTLMPDISTSIELKPLIYPIKIFISDIEEKGIPYIGFQFDCRWDKEHGIGIMLYKERVVKIGSSDVSFLSWIAEEDKEEIK